MPDDVKTKSESGAPETFAAILREAIFGTERDFTEGSLGTAIFILSVPMVIEMLAEGTFAIVDIFYVAKLGAGAIAVVGITESIMYLVYSVAIGVSVGATATVARRIGEKDETGAARAATHSIYLGIIASALMGIIGIIFAPNFLSLMGAEESVVREGANFTRIMLGGNFVVLFLFLLNAIFRGAGDASVAMRVLWIANILNIILCPIFIFALKFGVTGAAIGTTIGRGVGVAYAGYYLFRGEKRFAIHAAHWKFDRELFLQLIKISAPAVLQFFVQTASWIGIVRVITGFGSVVVAGYQIGIRVVIFALLPSIGLSNAAATLVGQNLGAQKPARAEKAVWTAAFYNALVQTSIGLLFVIFAEPVSRIFTDDPQILPYAVDSLRIISYGFLFYAIGMVLETAFNGAGDTWTPTFLNLFVFWLFEIPLAYFLAYRTDLKAHGAFWAITISFSVLAVASAIVFRRGKWKLKKV